MSMQDTLADMITRIKNGLMAGHKLVNMPSSKLKVNVAKVLLEEGYIKHLEVDDREPCKPTLCIYLKYYEGKSVIEHIKRESKPSLRVYKGKDNIPQIRGGFGIAIISTSQGIMTDKQARTIGEGGEILCSVA